ncbi:MAG: hypothetical protein SO173_06480 [Lachnospiraceae bacterium]|nr:hypothetical protein [Lachnospiraceae bacterium]
MKRKIRKYGYIAAAALAMSVLFVGCGQEKEPDTQLWETISKEDAQNGGTGDNDAAGAGTAGNNDSGGAAEGTGTAGNNDSGGAAAGAAGNTEDEEAGIYSDIIAEYRDMVQNNFYQDLLEKEDLLAYENSFGKDIGSEIRHAQKVYYALYDIDGNGTQELIIGGGEDASNPWNYDLYTYDGSKAVHVFPDFEFGYRTNFSLYENGIIEVFYSSSASESGNDFYRMNAAGTGAEIVENFSIIGSLDGDTTVITYYQGKNVITEDEYNRKTEEYEVALQTPFSWTEIK